MSAKPPVEKLYLTLRKGFAGKPRVLRHILRCLGFHRSHHTIEVKNYPSVRGMVEKVLHLLEVETDDQFYERKKKEAARLAPRPPVRVTHAMPYWLQYLPAENQKVTNTYDKDYFWEIYGKSRRYLEPDFVDKLKAMDQEREMKKMRQELGLILQQTKPQGTEQNQSQQESRSHGSEANVDNEAETAKNQSDQPQGS